MSYYRSRYFEKPKCSRRVFENNNTVDDDKGTPGSVSNHVYIFETFDFTAWTQNDGGISNTPPPPPTRVDGVGVVTIRRDTRSCRPDCPRTTPGPDEETDANFRRGRNVDYECPPLKYVETVEKRTAAGRRVRERHCVSGSCRPRCGTVPRSLTKSVSIGSWPTVF